MSGGFRSRSKSGDKPKETSQNKGRGQSGKPNKGNRRPVRNNARGRKENPSFVKAARRAGIDVARAVAYEVLRRVHSDDAFANLTLPKALRVHKLEARDAAFCTELTYGALRSEGVLDAVIEKCSSRGLGDVYKRQQ